MGGYIREDVIEEILSRDLSRLGSDAGTFVNGNFLDDGGTAHKDRGVISKTLARHSVITGSKFV